MANAVTIREEQAGDPRAIHAVTTAAFLDVRHRSGTEAQIVNALREARALTISLVAEVAGEIVGHIAFSPVTIDEATGDWFGLGPVSVAPENQQCGIGGALIDAGLKRLRAKQAAGCVLLGHPAYYARFGFVSDPRLRYGKAPPAYFQRLVFSGDSPTGEVAFHAAFEAGAA